MKTNITGIYGRHAPRVCLRVCLALLGFFGVLSALSTADAQRLRFRSSGLVTFAPTSEAYLAALGEAVEPERSSPDIRMRVTRSRRYTFRIERSAWSADAPELQARYVFSNRRGGRFETTWLSLDRPLQGTFTTDDNRTDISVAYRVQLTGREVADAYTTTVTYRAGNSSVQHDVRVVVPTTTALRVNGSLDNTQTSTVNFDYSGSRVMTYLRALEDAAPLPETSSDLRTVEVFSNARGGYSVDVDVSPNSVVNESNRVLRDMRDNLYLKGRTARGRRFSSTLPTYGFQPLASPDDFLLFVDGSEEPGNYTFQVTYEAQTNP